jgi:cobalt-zinc-cadmium efflux system outer membrane protein
LPRCCRVKQQLAVVRDSLTDLQRIEGVVRGRAEAGERSEYDVARAETEAERMQVDVVNAEADVDDAAGQLATLLGFPGWSPRATGNLEPNEAVPTDVEALWTTAQQRRPSLSPSAVNRLPREADCSSRNASGCRCRR